MEIKRFEPFPRISCSWISNRQDSTQFFIRATRKFQGNSLGTRPRHVGGIVFEINRKNYYAELGGWITKREEMMKDSPDRRNSLSSSSKHSPRKLCVDIRSRSSRLLRGRTTSGTLCNRPRFSTSCNVQKFENRSLNLFDRNRGDHFSWWSKLFELLVIFVVDFYPCSSVES